MSRIAEKFDELRDKGEGALIAFVTAGDPNAKTTVDIAKSLEDGGADIIELGLGFSDPIADGPTIQAASSRALKAGMSTDVYFETAKKTKAKVNVPLVCMTYFNPVLRRGVSRFMNDCKESGIGGVIIPDLPVEEAEDVIRKANDEGVDLILLATPTTTEARMKKIISSTSGFLYIVSLLGVTGARRELSQNAKSSIKLARKVANKVPVAVGFGISTPKQVREVITAGADGVIVGSAIVDIVAKKVGDKAKMLREMRNFVTRLKDATRIRRRHH